MSHVPRLSPCESEALSLLEALLLPTAGARPNRPASSIRIDRPRQDLSLVAAQRAGRAALRFLIQGGGARERTVLRQGRRVTGRLWDPHLNEGFSLRFTRATWDFWLSAARHFPRLSQGMMGQLEGERQRRRQIRDMVRVERTGTGDWLAFACAYHNLPGFLLQEEAERDIQRRLRAASPLCLLLSLQRDHDTGPRLAERMQPLLQPDAVRIPECLEDHLVATWEARCAGLWQTRRDAPTLAVAWNQAAEGLSAWLEAVDVARRMDLARCVMRLVRGLCERVFPTGPAEVRRLVGTTDAYGTRQQRDEMLAAMGRVLGLSATLWQRRDELAGERYGDERYEEAQLFLQHADQVLLPVRAQVDHLYRGLSGIIG